MPHFSVRRLNASQSALYQSITNPEQAHSLGQYLITSHPTKYKKLDFFIEINLQRAGIKRGLHSLNKRNVPITAWDSLREHARHDQQLSCARLYWTSG